MAALRARGAARQIPCQIRPQGRLGIPLDGGFYSRFFFQVRLPRYLDGTSTVIRFGGAGTVFCVAYTFFALEPMPQTRRMRYSHGWALRNRRIKKYAWHFAPEMLRNGACR